MKSKVAKYVKEIILFDVGSNNKVRAKYITEKPKRPFSKPVRLAAKKKSTSNDIIFFYIAGTKHHITTVAKIKKLRSLDNIVKLAL